jgi:ABC-2 type transport system permease protein/lipopolysaccharide transport system permease protein
VCRYRRSTIGPLWETINVLVMISGVTMVSSAVLGSGTILESMPYIGLGIISWSAISSLVNEGSSVFVKHSAHIRGTSISLNFYIGRTVFGNLITFSHHAILYFLGLLLLPIELHWTNLLALLGIILFYINAFWVVPLLGFLGARFRDVENIVRNLMQLAFFITPVFWDYRAIDPAKKFIVDFNILFYFLQIIREPLLGNIPPMRTYFIILATTLLGYILLYVTYRKMRSYLALYI